MPCPLRLPQDVFYSGDKDVPPPKDMPGQITTRGDGGRGKGSSSVWVNFSQLEMQSVSRKGCFNIPWLIGASEF